jgi:hypothetical protein
VHISGVGGIEGVLVATSGVVVPVLMVVLVATSEFIATESELVDVVSASPEEVDAEDEVVALGFIVCAAMIVAVDVPPAI